MPPTRAGRRPPTPGCTRSSSRAADCGLRVVIATRDSNPEPLLFRVESTLLMRSAIMMVLLAASALAQTPPKRIVIAASTVLDGKGGVLRNTRIVVEGTKIVAIDPKAA